jgi:hypothetical protein
MIRWNPKRDKNHSAAVTESPVEGTRFGNIGYYGNLRTGSHVVDLPGEGSIGQRVPSSNSIQFNIIVSISFL